MGMCYKCGAIKSLVVGALLLVNAFAWPKWLGFDGWVSFVAVLMVIGGFLKLVIPNKCAGCNACSSVTAMPAKKAPKRRKRR